MSHLYFIFLKLSIIFCTICLCNITNSSYRLLPLFRCLRREGKTLYLLKHNGPTPKNKSRKLVLCPVLAQGWTKVCIWNYSWVLTRKIPNKSPIILASLWLPWSLVLQQLKSHFLFYSRRASFSFQALLTLDSPLPSTTSITFYSAIALLWNYSFLSIFMVCSQLKPFKSFISSHYFLVFICLIIIQIFWNMEYHSIIIVMILIWIQINSSLQTKGYLCDACNKNHITKKTPKIHLSKKILYLTCKTKTYPKVNSQSQFQSISNTLKLFFRGTWVAQ